MDRMHRHKSTVLELCGEVERSEYLGLAETVLVWVRDEAGEGLLTHLLELRLRPGLGLRPEPTQKNPVPVEELFIGPPGGREQGAGC